MIHTAISTISDLRYKTKKVLKDASKSPVVVMHRTSPQGVILSMKKYQEMLDTIEDYYLSLRAQEYENEDKSNSKWISHSAVGATINKRK